MSEVLCQPAAPSTHAAARRPPALPPSSPRYCGPDRRQRIAAQRDWLGAALDELDYGVLLLASDGEVLHLNEAAAAELDAGHPLRRVGRHLQARCAADAALLQEALRNASQRGLRKLVSLGDDGDRVSVSVVPLGAVGAHGEPAATPTLLVLGKRQVCESLSVQGFARGHGLTTAESRVLAALCQGLPPTRIASDLGVAISTVRTQIGTIRVKTGAGSIRALVGQVAQLPPLRGVLRRPPESAGTMAALAMACLDAGEGGLHPA